MLMGLRVPMEDARGGQNILGRWEKSEGPVGRCGGHWSKGGSSRVTRLSRTFHLTRVAVITWKQQPEDWGSLFFFLFLPYSGMRFASSIIIEKRRGESGAGQTASFFFSPPVRHQISFIYFDNNDKKKVKFEARRRKKKKPGPLCAPVSLFRPPSLIPSQSVFGGGRNGRRVGGSSSSCLVIHRDPGASNRNLISKAMPIE